MEHPSDFVKAGRGRRAQDILDRALRTVRTHLDMDGAYLSEFVGDYMVFRAMDAPDLADLVQVGQRWPLCNSYCRHILSGSLPQLIVDTGEHALCQSLAVTRDLPIGSHVSVPVLRADGSVFGMFCCVGRAPKPDLNQRDLAIMRVFAELAGDQLRSSVNERHLHQEMTARIQQVIEQRQFHIKYQPIVDLAREATTGFEALARFDGQPYRSPDRWFADAEAVDLGVDLELLAVREALRALPELPRDIYVSVNVGPATVSSGRLREVFEGQPLERIVLEITEHANVVEDRTLSSEILAWRYRGVTIAIDDAGAGYSGLQQIVRLAPDLLKLDMSLTQGIDTDPVRRSLAAAMVHFATETGAQIVAEGVETPKELETLIDLGVHRAQGWLFGKPEMLGAAMARIRRERGGKVA